VHRVALLAFAAACGGGDDTIDRTFDPCALAITTTATGVQRAGIDAAVALWGFAPDDGATPILVRFEEAAPAFHGVYEDEIGEVVINERITDPRALSIVIAHELGHAFGLPHVGGRASLMNTGNLSIEPTVEDRADVSALWGSCDARLRSSRPR